VTTSSAASPFYVLVANNAVIHSATQLGIFLHTGGGGLDSVTFPANDTNGAFLDIFPSFNLTVATAIFGSQDPKQPNYLENLIPFDDDIFILGDLSVPEPSAISLLAAGLGGLALLRRRRS
jgi:hypothetical protein